MGKYNALFGAVIFSVFGAVSVDAKAPAVSLRPMPRGVAATEPLSFVAPRQPLAPVFYNATYRPKPNPRRVQAAARLSDVSAALEIATAAIVDAPSVSKPVVSLATSPPVFRSLKPKPRPKSRPAQESKPAPVRTAGFIAPKVPKKLFSSRKGTVCGDRKIKGQTLAPITAKTRGCGIKEPVKITEINGILLSQSPTMNCATAKSLQNWLVNGAVPAVGRAGGGIKSLTTVSDYSCRTRNSKKGAKISEHGKGNAIDVGTINLKNGDRISVLHGWRDRRYGPILKKMHRAACGPFGTVLGPNADRYHQDHFHFDISNRNRPYCR